MKKFVKLPKAVAGFCFVARPSRKYKKFEIHARWKDASVVQDIIDEVRAMAVEEFGEKKGAKAHIPFKLDEETGETVLKARSDFKPTVYNAKGEKIPSKRVPNVWGGSIVRVGVKFETFDNDGKLGVTARFSSIQIIKLVEGDGGGFEADNDEEDAYVEKGVDRDDEDDEDDDEDDEDNDDDGDAEDDDKDEEPKKGSSKKRRDEDDDDERPKTKKKRATDF